MHAEVHYCIETVRSVFPEFFDGGAVLEIGSADLGGSARQHFQARDYIGVDLAPGPGVDVVGNGAVVEFDRLFDVAISVECFEHNPQFLETLKNMVRHTRPGGLVLMTCASTGRPEHGTTRSYPTMSPGTVAVGWDYYRNLVAEDFASLPLEEWFSGYRFFTNRVSCDLYFVGLKRPFDIATAVAALDRIGAVLNVGEADRMTEQLGSMLDRIERLCGAGDTSAAAAEVTYARQKLERIREGMAIARNVASGVRSARSFRLALPSLRKRVDRLREILNGI
ncbi:class I SAM-dependent methyltransferase [Rhodoplanes elegans]|uniref:class I SAM-dependent methyltransferase n=1 Tax=Rhodoplanes elegans TaxID=29408 RepID=UPI001913A5FC|nr:class I SAM-dependent methyltransferase [Rhodoplanes elegans]